MLVLETGLEPFAFDAGPARLVPPEQVQRQAADSREVLGRMAYAIPERILPERDIERPVEPVLDAPAPLLGV